MQSEIRETFNNFAFCLTNDCAYSTNPKITYMIFHVSFNKILSVLLLLLVSVSAVAQDAAQAQRQHEQRLKEEQDRLQERLNRDNPRQDVFLQPEVSREENDIPTDENAPCIDVSLITVQGATVIDEDKIDEVTKSYIARCLSLQDINRLIADVSNLYLDKGYITSRAFVQPQKIEKGTLDLLIVEGKIEALQASGKMSQRQLNAAFPAEEKEILNLRDLEQGIEQLNRLQQNSAQLDIKPGSDTGLSTVNIINEQSRPLHGQIFVDNSGSEATGEIMVGGSLSWDNPLGMSDSLYINVSEATHGEKGGNSQSYAVNYSIPQGYFLWTISANHFNYEQLIIGNGATFTTSGESDNQSLGMDYVAYRSQRSKWSINSNLVKKVSKNYIEDVFLDTSSRTLYLGSIGINSTYRMKSAMLRGGLTWTRSFETGDATKKVTDAEVDYQFDKYAFDLGINGGFEVFKQNFRYSSSLNYFYSPTPIVASEALSLGGQYTIRGFEKESLTGYKGGYVRSEISYPQSFFNKIRFEPYVAYDFGQSDAPDYANYEKNKVSMSGGTIGFRSAYANVSVNASYSTALTVPEFFTKEQSVFLFDARIGF